MIFLKNISLPSVQLFYLPILILFFCTCNVNNGSDQGEEIVIIPGEGLSKIKIGASQENVKEEMGTPSTIGKQDWVEPTRVIFSYNVGVSILFFEDANSGDLGPVEAISVHDDFEGSTPEGIHLGSSLEELEEAYSEPDEMSGSSSETIYTYYFGSNHPTTFKIVNNSITQITIGIDFPLPPSN